MGDSVPTHLADDRAFGSTCMIREAKRGAERARAARRRGSLTVCNSSLLPLVKSTRDWKMVPTILATSVVKGQTTYWWVPVLCAAIEQNARDADAIQTIGA